MPSRNLAIAAIVVVLALALLPLAGSRYAIDLATQILIYCLFALSLNVLIGYAGDVSFGHAAYLAIGGYACAILLTTYRWPLVLALPASLGVSGLAAAAIGYFCVRLTQIYFAILARTRGGADQGAACRNLFFCGSADRGAGAVSASGRHQPVHPVLADGARPDPVNRRAGAAGWPGRSCQASWRASVARMSTMLKIAGLWKSFAGFVAIQDVHLELGAGETHAVIGRNGAGKTAFFDLITGRLRPDRGAVNFEGTELLGRAPERIVRLGIARSFQRINIYPRLSVFENVQGALIVHAHQHRNLFTPRPPPHR